MPGNPGIDRDRRRVCVAGRRLSARRGWRTEDRLRATPPIGRTPRFRTDTDLRARHALALPRATARCRPGALRVLPRRVNAAIFRHPQQPDRSPRHRRGGNDPRRRRPPPSRHAHARPRCASRPPPPPDFSAFPRDSNIDNASLACTMTSMRDSTRPELCILAGLYLQNERSFVVRRCLQRFLAGEISAAQTIAHIRRHAQVLDEDPSPDAAPDS